MLSGHFAGRQDRGYNNYPTSSSLHLQIINMDEMDDESSDNGTQLQKTETVGSISKASSSWKTHPVRNAITAPWDLAVSATDAKIIIEGIVPRTMEGKWLCYSDDAKDAQGNISVHFCRSWTGDETITLKMLAGDDDVQDKGGGWKVVEITWEAQDDEADRGEEHAKEDAVAVCVYVLGCKMLSG